MSNAAHRSRVQGLMQEQVQRLESEQGEAEVTTRPAPMQRRMSMDKRLQQQSRAKLHDPEAATPTAAPTPDPVDSPASPEKPASMQRRMSLDKRLQQKLSLIHI